MRRDRPQGVELTMPDFLVTDHGSIVIATPMTDDAKAWVGEYIDPNSPRYGGGIVIERRYWPSVYHGITEEAGLTVG